jgi:hypothetical protein
MRTLRGAFAVWIVGLLAICAIASAESGAETLQPGQAAADVLKDETGADGAFMASGLMKESSSADNLASALQYPSDDVVVLALKGALIRQAFERSISLYPHAGSSTLHLSAGFEVVFQPNADPGKRIVSITLGAAKLDDGKTYNIAMPGQLGRGGLGYFKMWDKTKIVRTISGKTLEDILKGKKATSTKSRWVAQ